MNTKNTATEEDLQIIPHNLEIEAALLSIILTNNAKMEEVHSIITADDFHAPHNARLYEIMQSMISKGQVVTLSTLKHIIPYEEKLKEKGLDYLAELATNSNPILGTALSHYAHTVKDLSMRRQLISVAEEVTGEAYDTSDLENTADKQLEKVEGKLFTLATKGTAERSILPLQDALKSVLKDSSEALARGSRLVGTGTGFDDLDKMTGGLYPSDLIIIAGRPAMGKTAFATNIAFNSARNFKETTDQSGNVIREGARVLFFSLEMSAKQLAMRILGEQARIPSDRMRKGMISSEDLNNLTETAMEISQIPLYIDDTPALSVSGVLQRARRWKRSKGLDLIIIDYVQLLQAADNGKRYENRVLEISQITRALKTIAKELNVPVIALSQLSREVEKREDKRPLLSDLRDSGSIEQDADIVMFLFREEYYLERAEPVRKGNESEGRYMERCSAHALQLDSSRDMAQLIIAKQRHGATGSIGLHFNSSLTKFSNLERNEHGS